MKKKIPTRRIISTICAMALMFGGAWIILYQVVFSNTIWGMFLMGGGFMLAVGFIWFIQDWTRTVKVESYLLT